MKWEIGDLVRYTTHGDKVLAIVGKEEGSGCNEIHWLDGHHLTVESFTKYFEIVSKEIGRAHV